MLKLSNKKLAAYVKQEVAKYCSGGLSAGDKVGGSNVIKQQNQDAVNHLFSPDSETEKWMRELVGLIMGGMHTLCKKQAARLLKRGGSII